MSDLLREDSPGVGFVFGTPQWGIFNQSGSPVLVADSFFGIEYARDYSVADYPQEEGAFESYNKVQRPYTAKVSYLVAQSRRQFLNNIEAACASLDLVTVLTPEINYPSANLIHYDFRRTSVSGVTMILVSVWLLEIRIAGSGIQSQVGGQNQVNSQTSVSGSSSQPQITSTPSEFTNTQSINGDSPTQSGQVQVSPYIHNPEPPT